MTFNDVKWKLPNGRKVHDAANEKIWSEQIMAFYLFYFQNVNVIRVMFSTEFRRVEFMEWHSVYLDCVVLPFFAARAFIRSSLNVLKVMK